MAQGFLDGLDAGARRHEHGRAAPGPGVLGHEQITVDALSLLVELQFDEVAVDFVGAVFFRPLFRIAQGESGGFLLVVFPELTEIGGHGGIGFDFLGREPDLDMVPGGLPADGGRKAAVAEPGALHGADGDGRPAVFEHDAAFCVGGHQVAAQFVMDGDAVLRDAVAIELYLNDGLFARAVEPVGMVGLCDPQHVAAVGIILGLQSERQAEERKKQ